jgi:hypothetical protein
VRAVGSSIPSTTTARTGSRPICSAWWDRQTERSAVGSTGRPTPAAGRRARVPAGAAARCGGGCCGARAGSGGRRSGTVVTTHLVSTVLGSFDGRTGPDEGPAGRRVEPATDRRGVLAAVHSPGSRPQFLHPP